MSDLYLARFMWLFWKAWESRAKMPLPTKLLASFRSMCAGGIMFIHFQHWTWFDVLQSAFLNQHDATAFVGGGMRSFTGRGNRGSLNPRFTCWTLSASPFWTEHWRHYFWGFRIGCETTWNCAGRIPWDDAKLGWDVFATWSQRFSSKSHMWCGLVICIVESSLQACVPEQQLQDISCSLGI